MCEVRKEERDVRCVKGGRKRQQTNWRALQPDYKNLTYRKETEKYGIRKREVHENSTKNMKERDKEKNEKIRSQAQKIIQTGMKIKKWKRYKNLHFRRFMYSIYLRISVCRYS